jgi:mono/diheme cytochrome c family protein
MTRSIVISLSLAIIVIALPATAGAQTAVEKGAALFTAQKCSMCHSLDGKGNSKGPLDGVALKYSADELRQWLVTPAEMAAKHGATRKPAMKVFATLPKEDLDALVAFLATKKKK